MVNSLYSQNMAARPDRSAFLYAPSFDIIDTWKSMDFDDVELDRDALIVEARASSAIEGLYDEDPVRRNLHALRLILDESRPLNNSLILDAHAVLMAPELDKLPGQWREYNVVVGRHRPPEFSQVPYLMKKFGEFISATQLDPVLRAVYGHIYFETVHPFADGNGRMGRAIVTRLLRRPWASAVYNDVQNYYRMLDSGSWDDWQTWMYSTLSNPKPLPQWMEMMNFDTSRL